MKSTQQKESSKKDSLERLKNQLEQAKIDGNTVLVKQIQAIIKRIQNEKPNQ
jgi:hypothetical protein